MGLFCLVFLIVITDLPIYGQQMAGIREADAVAGSIRRTNAEAAVYSQPDRTAAKIAILKKGSHVFVIQETDSFASIWYEEETAYIEGKYLEAAADNTALVQELQEQEMQAEQEMNDYLTEQRQRKSTMLWGSMIALILFLIFANSIREAIRQEKLGKEEAGPSGEEGEHEKARNEV